MDGRVLGTENECWSNIEMKPRTRAREEAICALFMLDFLEDWSENRLCLYFSHFEVEPEVLPYCSLLCRGVITDLRILDNYISRASDHWPICRMTRLDRCILRMSVFELFRITDVPLNVVMNEAIELAKLYGTEHSATFVNGVLDRVAKIITDERKKTLLSDDNKTEENKHRITQTRDSQLSHDTKLVA